MDQEKAAANIRNFANDFAAAYDRCLGSLGMRRERAKLPKHDPDEPGAVVLWRPEELPESEESGDSDDDEDGDGDDQKEDKSTGNGGDGETTKEPVIKMKKLTNALAIAAKKANKQRGKKVKVAIVVDPRLGSKLRPHQVAGVEFVYRCMMESKWAANNEYGEGCILGMVRYITFFDWWTLQSTDSVLCSLESLHFVHALHSVVYVHCPPI